MTGATSRYHVRQDDVAGYAPKNHSGTLNKRLIGRENVGAHQIEVVLGQVEKSQGAHAHAHPGIEQVCYMLEGTAHVEIGDDKFDMGPGDTCFFPAGEQHTFTATSETPAKVLVIYAPPYAETGAVIPDD